MAYNGKAACEIYTCGFWTFHRLFHAFFTCNGFLHVEQVFLFSHDVPSVCFMPRLMFHCSLDQNKDLSAFEFELLNKWNVNFPHLEHVVLFLRFSHDLFIVICDHIVFMCLLEYIAILEHNVSFFFFKSEHISLT